MVQNILELITFKIKGIITNPTQHFIIIWIGRHILLFRFFHDDWNRKDTLLFLFVATGNYVFRLQIFMFIPYRFNNPGCD